MSVTCQALEAIHYPTEIQLKPGYTNLTATYKSLDTMCQELGIGRGDIQKVDHLATWPFTCSVISSRPNHYCTTVRIKGQYLLLTWEGKEEHMAAHAYRFPRWSTPFTYEAIQSPPPPPPKRDSDRTLKEFLLGRWNKKAPEPFIYT